MMAKVVPLGTDSFCEFAECVGYG